MNSKPPPIPIALVALCDHSYRYEFTPLERLRLIEQHIAALQAEAERIRIACWIAYRAEKESVRTSE